MVSIAPDIVANKHFDWISLQVCVFLSINPLTQLFFDFFLRHGRRRGRNDQSFLHSPDGKREKLIFCPKQMNRSMWSFAIRSGRHAFIECAKSMLSQNVMEYVVKPDTLATKNPAASPNVRDVVCKHDSCALSVFIALRFCFVIYQRSHYTFELGWYFVHTQTYATCAHDRIACSRFKQNSTENVYRNHVSRRTRTRSEIEEISPQPNAIKRSHGSIPQVSGSQCQCGEWKMNCHSEMNG